MPVQLESKVDTLSKELHSLRKENARILQRLEAMSGAGSGAQESRRDLSDSSTPILRSSMR